MLYSIYFILLYGFLVLLRQGLHVVALLGLTLRCRESDFLFAEIRFIQLVPEPCLTVGRALGMVDNLGSRF
jgi:hypothetical protein